MAQRILVTGGAGLLGSHLCDRLLADGHDVRCLDNFSSGQRRNIAHLDGNARFTVIEHDVTIPIDIAADAICNLACPASPVRYQRDPVATTRTAVLGALNMLDLARRTGARVLQASTSEIYGDPDLHPQPEAYWGRVNPIGPRACYDEGKRCAETLFFDYHRQHGTPIKVARIFNTYGPRMDPADGRVVSNFIIQALGGAPISLYGDGQQTRSFCYVDDMVDGLARLLMSGDAVTGPINLGNPVEVTMAELAANIVRLTGSASPIVHGTLPADDPRRRCPAIEMARRDLGWAPTTGLDEGLARTIAYFRALPGVETRVPQ